MAYIGAVKYGFNGGSGTNLAMLHVQTMLHIPLTNYVPSLYRPHQLRLFALWLIAILCISGVTCLLARNDGGKGATGNGG